MEGERAGCGGTAASRHASRPTPGPDASSLRRAFRSSHRHARRGDSCRLHSRTARCRRTPRSPGLTPLRTPASGSRHRRRGTSRRDCSGDALSPSRRRAGHARRCPGRRARGGRLGGARARTGSTRLRPADRGAARAARRLRIRRRRHPSSRLTGTRQPANRRRRHTRHLPRAHGCRPRSWQDLGVGSGAFGLGRSSDGRP